MREAHDEAPLPTDPATAFRLLLAAYQDDVGRKEPLLPLTMALAAGKKAKGVTSDHGPASAEPQSALLA